MLNVLCSCMVRKYVRLQMLSQMDPLRTASLWVMGMVTWRDVCVCAHSCSTLCYTMDCSPPGSSVHGILQARTPEWVAMPSSRRSSPPRQQTRISCLDSLSLGKPNTKGAGPSDLLLLNRNIRLMILEYKCWLWFISSKSGKVKPLASCDRSSFTNYWTG